MIYISDRSRWGRSGGGSTSWIRFAENVKFELLESRVYTLLKDTVNTTSRLFDYPIRMFFD